MSEIMVQCPNCSGWASLEEECACTGGPSRNAAARPAPLRQGTEAGRPRSLPARREPSPEAAELRTLYHVGLGCAVVGLLLALVGAAFGRPQQPSTRAKAATAATATASAERSHASQAGAPAPGDARSSPGQAAAATAARDQAPTGIAPPVITSTEVTTLETAYTRAVAELGPGRRADSGAAPAPPVDASARSVAAAPAKSVAQPAPAAKPSAPPPAKAAPSAIPAAKPTTPPTKDTEPEDPRLAELLRSGAILTAVGSR